MGVMDKFLNAMRLNSDEDDYYDDDFYDDEEEEDDEEEDYEPRRRSPFRGRTRSSDDDYDDEDDYDDDYDVRRRPASSQRTPSQQSSSKVTPMRAVRRTTGSSAPSTNMEVCVIKPVSIDDAREVTETLITYRTVILNLEGLDLDIAQRIIDFTSGSCYAVSGNLQKISNYIFVVTPANVDISGDIQNIMSAFGDTSAIQTDI